MRFFWGVRSDFNELQTSNMGLSLVHATVVTTAKFSLNEINQRARKKQIERVLNELKKRIIMMIDDQVASKYFYTNP